MSKQTNRYKREIPVEHTVLVTKRELEIIYAALDQYEIDYEHDLGSDLEKMDLMVDIAELISDWED